MVAGARKLSDVAIMGRDGPGGRPAASELRLRATSSVALAAVAVATAWTGGWPLAAIWLGAGMAVAMEWLAMTRAEPKRPLAAVALVGLAALQIAFIAGSAATVMIAAIVIAAATLIVAAGQRDRAWALSGLAYAAAIAVVPVAVRAGPGGAAALFWMFAVVWSTDIAAYFTGRAFGGPKLWPAVSPKKTWSGFVGGLLGATLAGVAVAVAAERAGVVLPVGLIAIAAISAVVSVASQVGDFAESGMKRRFGVKDSGTLIPGHGGFMDRLDGFAAVALLVGLVLAAASLSAGTP
ncbi:phosphatidate cytidylyltransferase [uncultured Enterovirga sp.]|uniref:phosphatidate cytidylyltransferase n=1 Tax=uncultured Enterovirga sp. TaxID=2026352 RepID=UPI0035CB55E0